VKKIETKAPDPNCPECKGSGLSPLKSMPSVSANCSCTIVLPPKPSTEEVLDLARKIGEAGDFEMAEASELEGLAAEADQICDALEEILSIRISFLSDESSFSDFRPREGTAEDYYQKISAKLGVPIGPSDSVVEVARRLQKAKLI